jgi:ATP/maltotriose-dependent transcriptional regulator MalT
VARATLQLIDRGDLLAALDRASAKAVTIISAPASSGKTSLLRSWAARPDQRRLLAAVQVERGQRDAQPFWLALLGAIRQADLRFTRRETHELLAASGITLSAAAVARLHQRTEGWAAGLRLAAISLTGHGDPERFVAEFSGSDRTVAEYLIDEMLERQPDEVQQLLLRTSLR